MSAPSDRPRGFVPVGRLGGGGPSTPRKYYKSASVILGIGDPVVLSSTAEATTAVPEVTRAAAGSGTITGVVVGFDYSALGSDTQKHMAAADTGYVYVDDNPDSVFEIQEDGDGTPIAITSVGRFCDILTVADANTNTGLSTVELDSSDAGTGDQVRILSRVERPDNDLGAAGTSWLVVINEHTYNAVSTPI